MLGKRKGGYYGPAKKISAKGTYRPRKPTRRSLAYNEEAEDSETVRMLLGLDEIIDRPPKGFHSWEAYFINQRYGPMEYKYQDNHIGNDASYGGRVVLNKGGMGGGEPYGYNGWALHGRLRQGYDRNQSLGNKICMRSLDINMSIRQEWNYIYTNTDKFAQVRIFIVCDLEALSPDYNNADFANRRSDSTCPATDCLLANGWSIYDHYNLDVTKRYMVLFDKLVEIKPAKTLRGQTYNFRENGVDKTPFNFKTKREAHTNMFQLACQNGGVIGGDQRDLDGYIRLNLNQTGDLVGALPPDAVYTGSISDALLSDSTLEFGQIYLQPGMDGSGSVVQDQFEGVLELNPMTESWQMDTSEWNYHVHIDFEETEAMLKYYDYDGGWNYMEDNAIYLGIQTVSRTDTELGFWASSRFTYYND